MAKQAKDYSSRARDMVKASEGKKGRTTQQAAGMDEISSFLRQAKELFEALLFAAVAALFIKTFLVEAYRIPTGSMETTLKVGDFLLVNKFIYDIKTPMSVPFTNIRLPWMSFGGIRSPHKGDIIVFEYPGDRDEVVHEEVVQYIKRCVGVPGDTILVRDKMLYVNGVEFMKPPGMRFRIETPPLNFPTLQSHDSGFGGGFASNITATPELAEMNGRENSGLRFPNVSAEEYFKNPSRYHLDIRTKDDVEHRMFPRMAMWNQDNYGPLRVPHKGDVIDLDEAGFQNWYIIIRREGHTIDKSRGDVLIDGKPAKTYTLEHNYYFMMGDNRDDSEDSRFWGFVPDDNISGQAMLVYWSWDPSIPFANIFKLIGSTRWGRIFNVIR